MRLPGIAVSAEGRALPQLSSTPDVSVSFFLDYLCPYCKRLNSLYGATLLQLVGEGHAALVLYPVAFLDRFSRGSNYSTRTAAAAHAVAADSPDAFLAFSTALFDHQPREGAAFPSDAEIATIASRFGVEEAARLTDPIFEAQALELTRDAIDLGVQGTPTVVISRPSVGDILWDGQTPIPAVVRQVAEA